MSPKKPRGLSAEEQALWLKVTDTTEPISRRNYSLPFDPSATFVKPKPTEKQRKAPKAPGPSPPPWPQTEKSKPPQRVEMDQKAFRKLKRGKLLPEARIDLHGMTLDQAHPALLNFISRSFADGKRLVLVITGKGKLKPDEGPIPTRFGVLNHHVPGWLQQQPLKAKVLQITHANIRHGGTGAYYVYLKRGA